MAEISLHPSPTLRSHKILPEEISKQPRRPPPVPYTTWKQEEKQIVEGAVRSWALVMHFFELLKSNRRKEPSSPAAKTTFLS